MALLEKTLEIAASHLPGAGLGLFTKQDIPKGTRIVEYKGSIITWKEALAGKGFNAYVYYVNRNHVIDARPFKKALARYANDAKGLGKHKSLVNNAIYVVEGKRVYIEALKNIAAGSEILVSYGPEYWAVIKENNLIQHP